MPALTRFGQVQAQSQLRRPSAVGTAPPPTLPPLRGITVVVSVASVHTWRGHAQAGPIRQVPTAQPVPFPGVARTRVVLNSAPAWQAQARSLLRRPGVVGFVPAPRPELVVLASLDQHTMLRPRSLLRRPSRVRFLPLPRPVTVVDDAVRDQHALVRTRTLLKPPSAVGAPVVPFQPAPLRVRLAVPIPRQGSHRLAATTGTPLPPPPFVARPIDVTGAALDFHALQKRRGLARFVRFISKTAPPPPFVARPIDVTLDSLVDIRDLLRTRSGYTTPRLGKLYPPVRPLAVVRQVANADAPRFTRMLRGLTRTFPRPAPVKAPRPVRTVEHTATIDAPRFVLLNGRVHVFPRPAPPPPIIPVSKIPVRTALAVSKWAGELLQHRLFRALRFPRPAPPTLFAGWGAGGDRPLLAASGEDAPLVVGSGDDAPYTTGSGGDRPL